MNQVNLQVSEKAVSHAMLKLETLELLLMIVLKKMSIVYYDLMIFPTNFLTLGVLWIF